MQMSKRVRGSVSVLLCLVLLPMITYSTMIIDASRLQSVRSNIAGAGDLTLNAIMSDYNILLEEMYGLFANTNLRSEEDKEALQDALKAYFQQTVEGKFVPTIGKDGELVQNTINSLIDYGLGTDGAIDEDALTDFLQLQLQTFTADPVVGSALANPNTMKRQIVEYMKYRGPVSIASTLLGKLDYLSDSTQQVDACEKKIEYTEQLDKLEDPCLATYDQIESKYNPGALLMNELFGEEGKGVIKGTTDHMKQALDYSKQELGYATAFYLMEEQSPFFRNNKDDAASANIRIFNTDDTVQKEYHDYQAFLDEAAGVDTRYAPDTSEDENTKIQEDMKKLNDIIQKADELCGFKLDSHNGTAKIEMDFEDVSLKISTGNRTPGEFNKFSLTKFDPSDTTYAKYEYKKNQSDDPSKKILYPNYELLDEKERTRELGTGGSKAVSYYAPLDPFIDLDKYASNEGINNSDVPPSDTTPAHFLGDLATKSQMEQSLAVLKAQWELNDQMRKGIAYLAGNQKKLQQLAEDYDKIWKDMTGILQKRYREEVKRQEDANKVKAWNEGITVWNNRWNKNETAPDLLLDNGKGELWWNKWNIEGSGIRDNWQKFRDGEIDKDGNEIDPAEPRTYKENGIEYYSDADEPGPPSSKSADEISDSDLQMLWDHYQVSVDPVDKDKVWSDVLQAVPSLNAMEKSALALNHFSNSVYNGWDSYHDRINKYISKLAHHNDEYFGKYGKAYTETGYSELMALALTLLIMKDGLTEAQNQLKEIMKVIDGVPGNSDYPGLKNVQNDWESSIGKVNSDSTQASMRSDFKTLAGQFDQEEVKKFQKLIDKLKSEHVEPMLEGIQKVTFLGEPLLTIDQGGPYFSNYKDKNPGKIVKELLTEGKSQRPLGDYFNLGLKGDTSRSPKCDDSAFDIVEDAGKSMWDLIVKRNTTIKLPDYQHHADIKAVKKQFNAEQTDANKDDYILKVVDKLVKEKYVFKGAVFKGDTMITYEDGFGHFQILDGIQDDLGYAVTRADQKKADLDELNKKYKDKKDFMDPAEAFMITLYTEAKAHEKKVEHEKEVEEKESEGETAPEDNISDTADGMIDSANEEVTDERDDKEAPEDYEAIMKSIEDYCDQTEANQVEAAPTIGSPTVGKGDKKSDANSKNGLGEAKKALAKIAGLASTVAENVYLEEYFTEMFTCRTDNQMLNSLTKTPDKGSMPVILLNGYHNQGAVSSIIGDRQLLNEKTDWYGKEIEFLLWGNCEDLNKNLTYTDAMIFAIRFALNAIYAFTAPDIQSYALELATAIAGWTVIGVPIVQVCITILIALAESGYDLYLLHDGREVPIYKNQSTFVCSPTGFLRTIAEEAVKKVTDTVIPAVVESVEDKLDEEIDKFEATMVAKGEDFANKKLDDCADILVDGKDSILNTYCKRQYEAIRDGICDQFITPVLNKIIPLGSALELGAMYNDAKATSELVAAKVDEAFAVIEENFNSATESGVVGTICGYMVKNVTVNVKGKDINCGQIYKDLKKEITEVIDDYMKLFGTEDFKNFDLEAKLREAMDNAFQEKFADGLSAIVNQEIDKAKQYISDEIHKAGDKAADTAKSIMREKMDEASSALTGKIKEGTKDFLKDIPQGEDIDTNASSGITLNYKEYCKIFMLLAVSTNQNAVLQRAAVLITVNMRHAMPVATDTDEIVRAQDTFDITHANTMFSVNAQVRMMTLFPWPVKDVQDETSPDTGLQLDLNNIRSGTVTVNYCGINGY
ncbi:MAG: hypothetical protein IK134_08670 [Oscillospiraceae bacterium]|nr:hypothetical protein [Oscillospiraceae bacterium]